MEFFDFDMLKTFSGTLLAVLVITQLTKDFGFTVKMPTQLWSYIVAFIVLLVSNIITGNISIGSIVLMFFNAALIAFAANGGFEALNRVMPKVLKRTDRR